MTAHPLLPPGRPRAPSGPAPLSRGFATAVRRGLARIAAEPFAPYQAAVLRIGLALTWLALLLREWVDRAELYGPDGSWSWDMGRQWNATTHAFTPAVVRRLAVVRGRLRRGGRRVGDAAPRLADPDRLAALHDHRDGGPEPQPLRGQRRRQPSPHHGDLPGLHALRRGLVAGRAPRREGPEKDPDPAGIALWVFFAAVLTLVTGLGRLGMGWALPLWGFLAAQSAGWLVRRGAPGNRAPP
ncbi:hypothetical protein ACFQ3Z_37475 [Streptomyces nogalater]